MDKTAIKNFAVWARVKLMEDIRTRLGLLGITEDGISDPMPASTNEVKYFDIGADHPVSIKGKAIRQREQLAEEIRKAGEESNYQSAYRNFIESSAYDWFNRLIAIRYMEVNEYAPLDVRLLSSVEPGKQDPDLLSTPFDGSLEYSESETQQILAWKEQHDYNKLFRFLLFKMCNQLHEVLPGIFEARDDASELLMRQSFIDKDGIIHHLVNDISEEDWKDQVQIIGWIYQYYNSELKAEVFAKKEKITKDELPAVTQLFTPDWIVRYMVENSLGRLWIEHLRGLNPNVDEKETAEKFGWKYYLPEAKQEPEVEQQLAKIREEYAALKPEDLSCLDPCMGSGHILVYMFDVLEQIYTSVGYSEREAAKAILENNTYGLDIDDRAYQLAYFAVMMKARQYNRRILTSGIKAHVYSIQESNGITKNQLQEMGENLSPDEKSKALSQAEKLVELFHDAKEYGSILNIPEMDWDLLRRFATPEEKMGQISLNWNQEASEKLKQLIGQGEVMASKYWITCTNPPYMTMTSADLKLRKYLERNYSSEKADLYSTFIKKVNQFLLNDGVMSMITMQSWMSLPSFLDLRKSIINEMLIVSLEQLGAHAFDEIGGEVVSTTAFIIKKSTINNYIGVYQDLQIGKSEAEKENMLLSSAYKYYSKQKLSLYVPNCVITYAASEHALSLFNTADKLSDYVVSKPGMQTSDNDRFLRLWFEVNPSKIGKNLTHEEASTSEFKWFPYNKGISFKRWYGNNEYIVNFHHDGEELKYWLVHNPKDPGTKHWSRNMRNYDFYFKPGITYTAIGEKFSGRLNGNGYIFDTKGPTIFGQELEVICGFVNSKVFEYYNRILCKQITKTMDSVNLVPFILPRDENYCLIRKNVQRAVELTKKNYNTVETATEFARYALVNSNYQYIEDAIRHQNDIFESEKREIEDIQKNINQIYINLYKLNDELTCDVKDSEITLNIFRIVEQVKMLLSYAIGCMFGRYSLDKEGLIYAGGDWKSVQSIYKTFLPDRDNVIPITDQKYLDDDVVERICEFLTVVYGVDTLEENLDFIAKALGKKGLTSREVIRGYMLNDFFKDHCKTYSVTGSGKRPIYWLFDSGKENAFKALVYMHRWDADTTGRVLLYAQQIQQKYETEIRAIDMMLDHITDARQKSTEEKRQEHLKKQLEELVDYEERLEHMANERIAIDLDDGVKINYEKVQTDRNGKKYQILAPIK